MDLRRPRVYRRSNVGLVLNFFLNIEKELWKEAQSRVELMRINFKFEAPILQVQITYIIYLIIW